MQWNDDLTILKNELAKLYPTKDDSYPVVREADLRSDSIAFKDKAANNWSEIIDAALHQEKIFHIIRVALRNYPNNEILQSAKLALFRQSTMYSLPVGVFYFYAPKDSLQCNDLERHIRTFIQGKEIVEVYDRAMPPEAEWAQKIITYVDAARIFLVLISPDFVANYSQRLEVKRALERHLAEEARIIPILLYPTNLEGSLLSGLQCLPKNGKPVMDWESPDLAYEDIVMDIHKFVVELRMKDQSSQRLPIVDSNFQRYPDSKTRGQTSTLSFETEIADGKLQASFNILSKFDEFRRCQKQVSMLKGVHNMLHEIEWMLIGLSATIQLQLKSKEEQENKTVSVGWFLRKREIRPSTINFRTVKVFWQQVFPKIDDLKLFADKKMEVIGEKPFSFDDNIIRGPIWVIELVKLQRDFEVSVEDQNIAAIDNLSGELLTSCRKHLYNIDRQLRDAVEELEYVSTQILRYIP
jgi:hypothetical protein